MNQAQEDTELQERKAFLDANTTFSSQANETYVKEEERSLIEFEPVNRSKVAAEEALGLAQHQHLNRSQEVTDQTNEVARLRNDKDRYKGGTFIQSIDTVYL